MQELISVELKLLDSTDPNLMADGTGVMGYHEEVATKSLSRDLAP